MIKNASCLRIIRYRTLEDELINEPNVPLIGNILKKKKKKKKKKKNIYIYIYLYIYIFIYLYIYIFIYQYINTYWIFF